jgi:large subunit ribosomal protein L5
MEGGIEMAPRLKEKYKNEVVNALMEKFKYESVMEVPKIEKVVINMGLGEGRDNPKIIESAVKELEIIAGQKPLVTKAKKSIANFKLREGMSVGTKVTLRGDRMYYFLDKLINIALPRVRDFRGVSGTAFDGRGNYAIGIKEQLIFPEIEYDKVDSIKGLDVAIVTTAKTDEEAKVFLKEMGMPFKK